MEKSLHTIYSNTDKPCIEQIDKAIERIKRDEN